MSVYFENYDYTARADLRISKFAYEIPEHNDLYIDKNGFLQRRKGNNRSKRAQKRFVVIECWKTRR